MNNFLGSFGEGSEEGNLSVEMCTHEFLLKHALYKREFCNRMPSKETSLYTEKETKLFNEYLTSVLTDAPNCLIQRRLHSQVLAMDCSSGLCSQTKQNVRQLKTLCYYYYNNT